LAKLYLNSGKLLLAEKLLLKSQSLLLNINSNKLKIDNIADLSDLYYKMGNYKKAMDYHLAFIVLKDSMLNDESYRKIMGQQAEFEYEKKAAADSVKVSEEKKMTNLQFKQEKTQRFALYGGLILVLIFAGFMFNRFKITQKQKNIIELKEEETKKQNIIITQQKHLVEEKHKEITDSINYAERIQRSFLATKELLDENLKDYFVFFKPKDIVSGDFYWADTLSNGNFALVTADSTGHGVPGAIMSLLNITSLENAVKETTEPAQILNLTRQTIITRLKKDGSAEGGKDGMDCSIIVFDKINNKLIIAGANNPVWIVRSDMKDVRYETENKNINISNLNTHILIEIKPDKIPVGKHDRDTELFTQHIFDLQSGDIIYTLTDGFPDQFGGVKGKKFMSKNLKELLLANAHLPMHELKQLLETTFKNWIGNLEQVDDVIVIGIKI